MTTDNGNRDAFPSDHDRLEHGLTKREYFAALAMQGMLAGNINKYPNGYGAKSAGELLISQSLGYADELLKQLEDV